MGFSFLPSKQQQQQFSDHYINPFAKFGGNIVNTATHFLTNPKTPQNIEEGISRGFTNLLHSPSNIRSIGNAYTDITNPIQILLRTQQGRDLIAAQAQDPTRRVIQTQLQLQGKKSLTPQPGIQQFLAGKGTIHTPKDALGYAGEAAGLVPPIGPKVISSMLAKQAPKVAEGVGGLAKTSGKVSPEVGKYIGDLVKSQDAARTAQTSGDTSKITKLRQALTDQTTPIAQRVKGLDLAPSKNPDYQIDRALNSSHIATQFVHDNGLAHAIQQAPNVDHLSQYLIAKHAADVAKNGVETGRNLEKDQQLIKELAPTYEPIAKLAKNHNEKLLDYSVEKGLVDPKMAKELKDKYPNYIPLGRIMDHLQEGGFSANGVGNVSKQNVLRRLVGSDRQIEDPLATMVNRTHEIIHQGEKNDVFRMVTSPEVSKQGNPFNLSKIHPDDKPGPGLDKITGYVAGKKVAYTTDKDVAEALKGADPVTMGIVGKVLNAPVRALKVGATGLNPVFLVKNVAKDQVSAFINSNKALQGSVLNPKNFVQAFFSSLGHGKLAQEATRGGALGTSYDVYRNAPKQTISAIRSGRSASARGGYLITHPGQLFRATEDLASKLSEKPTRLAEYGATYKNAIKKGMGEKDARALAERQARNASVNFGRSGSVGRQLNQWAPYLNAGIQGSRTLLRNLKERPVATIAKLTITSLVPMASTTVWNLSDPKRAAAYHDIPDYEKQNNIIIVPPNPTKDKNGNWNVYKIPMSQEIANLMDGVRSGVENAAEKKPQDFAKMGTDLLSTATSLNLQSPNALISQLTPQAVKTPVEVATNTNLFTGKSVVPDSVKGLPKSEQVGPNTSAIARLIGGATGSSPLTVDNAIGTNLGQGGRQIQNLADKGLVASGAAPKNEVGGRGTIESITGSFTKASGGQTSISNTLTAARNTLTGKQDRAQFDTYTSPQKNAKGQTIQMDQKQSAKRANDLFNMKDGVRSALQKGYSSQASHDPMWDAKGTTTGLNGKPTDKLKLFAQYESLLPGDPNKRLIAQGNPWIFDLEAKRGAYFNNLPTGNGPGIAKNTSYVPYPLSTDEAKLMATAASITDPTAKTNFYKNTDIASVEAKYGDYENKVRSLRGYGPLPTPPQAPPGTQSFMDKYFSASVQQKRDLKSGNPGGYANMQAYLADSAINSILRQASLDYAKGGGDAAKNDQKLLKEIASVGQYDVSKTKNPDGSYSYSFDPTNKTGAAGGSGSKASSASLNYWKTKSHIQTQRAINTFFRGRTKQLVKAGLVHNKTVSPLHVHGKKEYIRKSVHVGKLKLK